MLILPGLRGTEELAAISRLIGERRGWEASLHQGGRTYQLHDDTVLRADEIRELPSDHGLLLYRNAPACLLRLPSVWEVPRWRHEALSSTALFDEIVASGTVPEHLRPTSEHGGSR